MRIERDDPGHPAIRALLEEHRRDMLRLSPPESVHAPDPERPFDPDLVFWSAWDGNTLLACGALKELDRLHGEIKAMRTAAAHRHRGAGRAILAHILLVARARGYQRVSLETGATAAFTPAHRLYQGFGFTFCEPFGGYRADPDSVFMTLYL